MQRARREGRATAVLTGALLLLMPRAASAHVAFAQMGSFWAGVLYPLTSLDQIGFLLGLAILASFQRRRHDIWLIAAAFLGCAVGCAIANVVGWPSDAGALMAALMILVGLAGAVCLRVAPGPLIGLASAGGSIVGGSGAAGSAGLVLPLFSLGASTALASVLSYGLIAAANTVSVRAAWPRIALRAGASWIAAIGVMILAFAGTQLLGHR
jgi:hydrogenase/urease accessory protein HupE